MEIKSNLLQTKNDTIIPQNITKHGSIEITQRMKIEYLEVNKHPIELVEKSRVIVKKVKSNQVKWRRDKQAGDWYTKSIQ